MSSVRIQVVLDEQERASFRRQARAEGLSLSAWLRDAGRDRVRRQQAVARFRNLDDLAGFFDECDRQAGEGRESDWEEHVAVIARSRGEGNPEP